MKRAIILIALLSTILLAGCSKSANIEKASGSNGCIPPITNFDFPITRVSSTSVLPDRPPGYPWQEIVTVPSDNYATTPFLTRKAKDGGNEIWFVSKWGHIEDGRIKNAVKYILIFNTKENKWEKIDNFFEGTSTQIFGVYELADGSVIADGFSPTEHFIATFDERKRVFIENTAIKNVLDGPLVFDTKRQLFWAFIDQAGIFSIDPINGNIKFWISLPNLYANTFPTYASVKIADNGDIYLLYNTGTRANLLHKFVPETGSFTYIYDPIREYYSIDPNSLFITKSGELWVNDTGWLDKDGVWHQIIRSPVFIVNREPESGYEYSWEFGTPFYESTNGFLWFSSDNGIAYLDTMQEKWCWVTTDITSVIEDDDNTLWMIAYGKLYKMKIS